MINKIKLYKCNQKNIIKIINLSTIYTSMPCVSRPSNSQTLTQFMQKWFWYKCMVDGKWPERNFSTCNTFNSLPFTASHLFHLSTSQWVQRPALMAEWSTALPLTITCLSPQSRFESLQGHVRRLLVIWVKAVVLLGTLVSSTSNNCLLMT